MEAVPRTEFVADRYADLSFKNIALPADRGQSVPEPLVVARLLAGSRLEERHRVLLVGIEAGYVAAVLSHLVEEVVVVDRLPSLLEAARQRFTALGRDTIALCCTDALVPPGEDTFDRILLMGAVDQPPDAFWARLRSDGAIVHARNDGPGSRGSQVIVRVERQADGTGRQAVLAPSRMADLRFGAAPGER